MNFIKKQNAFGWVLLGGAVLSLIAMIIYAVNSTTGYLAGQDVNAWPIALPIIAMLGAVALWLFSDKLDTRITAALTFALALLMAFSIVTLVAARIDLFGDMLNPVNHPASEGKAVNVAIAAIVFNALAFVAFTVTTVAGKLHRDI